MATGYVYDHIFLAHNDSTHPENAKRLEAIIDHLEQQSLLSSLVLIPTRQAQEEELLLAHSQELISSVMRTCSSGRGMLDPDTYYNQYSYEAATKAVGSSLDLAENIIDGTLKNGFAFVRPPGHHAGYETTKGFCIFNTIAIIAKTLIEKHAIQRVAIVDFDVHHGNGTQEITASDDSILYISSHQYPFYPGTGHPLDCGSGDKNTIINIPLPAGTGDIGFQMCYRDIVFPAVTRFKPEFILVSAGFDAHWKDYLAGLNVSIKTFHRLGEKLLDLADNVCDGKIMFCLEGGYNTTVLRYSIEQFIRLMTGSDVETQDPFGPYPGQEPDLSEIVKEICKFHHLEV